MKFTRLFRCSNEKGYFTISEKCSDFCQVSIIIELHKKWYYLISRVKMILVFNDLENSYLYINLFSTL